MGLTTEVLIFEASETFRDNPELASPTPAFDIGLKEGGGVRAPFYYGNQIENPSTGYIFLNWDSLEAHQAVIDSATYTSVLEALKPCMRAGGKRDMYHVEFSAPTIALQMSVTEVLILTLKAPENLATVVGILTKISEASEKRLVFGQTREDENKIILIGGWPSVEAHLEIIAQPDAAAAFEMLYTLANKEHHYHTKLSHYPL